MIISRVCGEYWTSAFTVFRPSVPTGLLGGALLGGAGISSFSFNGSIYKRSRVILGHYLFKNKPLNMHGLCNKNLLMFMHVCLCYFCVIVIMNAWLRVWLSQVHLKSSKLNCMINIQFVTVSLLVFEILLICSKSSYCTCIGFDVIVTISRGSRKL